MVHPVDSAFPQRRVAHLIKNAGMQEGCDMATVLVDDEANKQPIRGCHVAAGWHPMGLGKQRETFKMQK